MWMASHCKGQDLTGQRRGWGRGVHELVDGGVGGVWWVVGLAVGCLAVTSLALEGSHTSCLPSAASGRRPSPVWPGALRGEWVGGRGGAKPPPARKTRIGGNWVLWCLDGTAAGEAGTAECSTTPKPPLHPLRMSASAMHFVLLHDLHSLWDLCKDPPAEEDESSRALAWAVLASDATVELRVRGQTVSFPVSSPSCPFCKNWPFEVRSAICPSSASSAATTDSSRVGLRWFVAVRQGQEDEEDITTDTAADTSADKSAVKVATCECPVK